MRCLLIRRERYFYPRPPRGGRPHEPGFTVLVYRAFLSTPSARRATSPLPCIATHGQSFLSTPSARRATRLRVMSRRGTWLFLSTPSARRATTERDDKVAERNLFLSTPSARRATWAKNLGIYAEPEISIHALREEGDAFRDSSTITKHISIHALREEGDSKNRDKISIFL